MKLQGAPLGYICGVLFFLKRASTMYSTDVEKREYLIVYLQMSFHNTDRRCLTNFFSFMGAFVE